MAQGERVNYATFLIAPIIMVVGFFAITLIFQKADDIPLAQGLTEAYSTLPLTEVFIDIINVLVVTTIVQLIILILSLLLGVYRTTTVVAFTILSLLAGFVLSFSPLGESLIWSIVVRFHLKQYDQYLNMFINLLRSGLIFVVATLIGIGLVGIFAVFSRLKTNIIPS